MASVELSRFQCRRCNNEILPNDTAIYCKGICGLAYHKQCTNLSREKVKLVVETPNVMWFCDMCKDNVSVIADMLSKFQESIDHLNNTVSEQTKIIQSQHSKLMELHNNLKLVKNAIQRNSTLDTVESPTSQKYKPGGSKQGSDNNQRRILPQTKGNSNVNKPNGAILSAEIKTTADKTDRDNQQNKNEEFQIVQSQSRKKRSCVKGTNTNSILKGTEKKAWIYVTNLHKETTVNQIETLLSTVCTIDCEKLNLRHSEQRSSFKICAPYKYKEDIMNGELWPVGTLLNRYFFPKRESMNGDIRNCSTSEDFLNKTVRNLSAS